MLCHISAFSGTSGRLLQAFFLNKNEKFSGGQEKESISSNAKICHRVKFTQCKILAFCDTIYTLKPQKFELQFFEILACSY